MLFRVRVSYAVVIALLLLDTAPANLMLHFDNQNPDYTNTNVFVMFGGTTDTNNLNATISGGGAIELGTNYSLHQLSPGVSLNKFTGGGKIFISVGGPMTSAASGNAFNPNFNNTSGADYGLRWDKIEISYTGSSGDGMNLSANDFFSVPFEVRTTGGNSPTTLSWRASTATVFESVGQLTGYNTTPDGLNAPPVVTGAAGVSTPLGSTTNQVVRVISPATISSNQATKFPAFTDYLTSLQTNGTTTKIEGDYFATGETYLLEGRIADSAYTTNGLSVSPGDLELSGTISTATETNQVTLLVRSDQLTSFDIYGVNPEWTNSLHPTAVGQVSDNNAAAGAIVDMVSGLNFGLVGSTEINPNLAWFTNLPAGLTIGDSPSYTWYGNSTNGLLGPKLNVTNAFGAAQTNSLFYNPYAGYLTTVTDAYGLSFTDRLEAPLASLDGVTSVEITILSDLYSGGGPADVIPEPAAWLLAVASFLALLPLWLLRRARGSSEAVD